MQSCDEPRIDAGCSGATKRIKSGTDRTRAQRANEQPNHDVYDEIMQHSAQGEAITTAYDSWLRKVSEFSCSGSIEGDQETDIQQVRSLKDEIASLASQLSLLKRRLAPAAEACAEAYNALHMERPPTTSHAEFLRARRTCNPMECLGEGRNRGLNSMFINRSAIKLANINAILGFNLTTCWKDSATFDFVDLCGAPGGFSEYIIRHCRTDGIAYTIGYGMSLTGSNEDGKGLNWKIDDMEIIQDGLYSKYTICQGTDSAGSGDVSQWANVVALSGLIRENSLSSLDVEKARVHLVLADGGMDAQREHDNQEEVTQKLVVSQVTAALGLLRQRGTFVLKAFGFQTPVIRSMMIDLGGRFESIKILKPVSSRPASTERYVVFHNYRKVHPMEELPAWQSRILESTSVSFATSRFSHWLDRFDRDMLCLNLKACFSILTVLDTNRGVAEGTGEGEQQVDVQSYKLAWRLA